ncbi:competence protein [Oceanobacillus piezotolerans]|uniref:Competence protein n=1 Tax=Oceanobacillus piezotolerans TaxID=2448030 RepID=A0A498DM16_9BACI|nr:competence type IV pilus ATPase ComGA [Oceanobacillus piezotolerans]RLL48090.1 competence protein [Oceanobacillus piezotolerans]
MNTSFTFSGQLLKAALLRESTDIHFSPFPSATNIYFRILGKRMLYKKITPQHYHLLLSHYKFISGMDIGETRKPQNGAYQYQQNNASYSLRLSTLPLNNMESLAIRILPQDQQYSLQDLFLFPYQVKRIKEWIANRSGLILLTGPTGSGKTTALYTLLETILKEKSYQTITLEDPIEKELQDILQVQVNEKAGVTYQTGLKAALRHDPDIIMIGEIRDKYTASFVFEAALTGHLVLSTLHAKNAVGTIQRLLEMGIRKMDIIQTLIAVASTQLIPLHMPNTVQKRAAILELLEGEYLEKAVKGVDVHDFQLETFEKLRRKAFAYGFINEETYHETK